MGVPAFSEGSVIDVLSLLRSRVCGRCLPPKIHGYDSEKSQLFELIKRTATHGESNSLLVIGPRGSGKTTLLQSALEDLRKEAEVKDNLIEVQLNGLLQTDDRIALKEITRQLQLENTVGDKVFGSFSENLHFLLGALKSGGQNSKSILFVLDEFDLFAHHKNQTLLYNLFDVAQSAQAPICVLGLTVRLDVIELLEKRVKSRFSHRQLHLLPKFTFEEYVDISKSYLTLPNAFKEKAYTKEWNKTIESIHKDPVVLDLFRQQFYVDKNVQALLSLLFLALCKVNSDEPLMKSLDFVNAAQINKVDSKACLLKGLSVLEFCLIIAMKHLTETYDGEAFNFEMVHREYQKFAQKRSSMQCFEKQVVLKAFEHLIALELVQPTDGANSKTQKEYRPMTLLVDSTQVLEAVQKYAGCPTDVKQWASSQVL